MKSFGKSLLMAIVLLAIAGLPHTIPSALAASASDGEARPARMMRAERPPMTVAPAAGQRSKVFADTFAAAGGGSQEWQCTEFDTGAVTCECKGMNDCKNLLDSGKCKGKSWWEDSNDPSIGGCDGSNKP